MTDIVVLIGAGAIGRAIARRFAPGRIVLAADLTKEITHSAAEDLRNGGLEVVEAHVDVADKETVIALATHASTLGPISHVIHTAGVSPAQTTVERIVQVDLVGTAHVLDAFAEVIAPGGVGFVISSLAGHSDNFLPAQIARDLVNTPTHELASLPFITGLSDTPRAYNISKRGNILRVQSMAVEWAKRGARLNSISPGIIITPLAREEFAGPRAQMYQDLIAASPAGRAGTPEEVAAAAEYIASAPFITGSDLLIDGGLTALSLQNSLRIGEETQI